MGEHPDDRQSLIEPAAILRHALSIEDVDIGSLLSAATRTLGLTRAAQLYELARRGRLSRRPEALASIVSLIVGTRRLGEDWWSREHESFTRSGAWVGLGSPETLLRVSKRPGRASADALHTLSEWVSEDLANATWGRPVAWIDANDPSSVRVVNLSAAASIGDRIAVAFDAVGGRAIFEVVGEGRGETHRYEVETSEHVTSSFAGYFYPESHDAWWACSMLARGKRILFPEEEHGTRSDPYAGTITSEEASRLRAMSVRLGATSVELGTPWTTKGDLWDARSRLRLPYDRSGEWLAFDQALVNTIDRSEQA